MKLPPGRAGRLWDEREQRLGESPNSKEILQDSRPKEAVCKATCLKDGFQWVFTLLSCPMQTCFACRITGSCLDFRCLARAGRPFVHPIDLWYFPSRESTESAHFSCAFAGSKAPKNLTRTMRPPAVRACPRTRPGEDLKIFDSFFRKTSSNMVLFKLRFRQAQPPFTVLAKCFFLCFSGSKAPKNLTRLPTRPARLGFEDFLPLFPKTFSF